MIGPIGHDWVARHMVAGATRLLSADEEEAFDAHLAACAECRSKFEAYVATDRPAEDAWQDGHIPAEYLAHWDRARDELTGFELEAVTEHLGTCELCREGLRVSNLVRGTKPEPEKIVDLTESLSVLHGIQGAGKSGRSRARARRSATVRTRLLATWAIVASAAAVVAVVALMSPGRVRNAAGPGPTIARRPTAERTPTVALLPRSGDPLLLASQAPDMNDHPIVRRVGGTGLLIVRVTPLLVAEGSDRVAIEVLDSYDRVVLGTNALWRDVRGGRDVVIEADPDTLPAGNYTLRVRRIDTGLPDGGASRSATYILRIEN